MNIPNQTRAYKIEKKACGTRRTSTEHISNDDNLKRVGEKERGNHFNANQLGNSTMQLGIWRARRRVACGHINMLPSKRLAMTKPTANKR